MHRLHHGQSNMASDPNRSVWQTQGSAGDEAWAMVVLLGMIFFPVSFVTLVVAKIGAWWHHG